MEVNYTYLRPQKAKAMKNAYENFKQIDVVGAKEYDNATVLPLKTFSNDKLLFGRGGVVDNQGKYVLSSAVTRRVEGSYECQVNEIVDERIVYCGYLVKHWGHFLIEAVARLWFFLEANNEEIDKYVFMVDYGTSTEIKGNYEEFFDLLEISGKLEIINEPTAYKKVIVPELSYKYNNCYTNQYKKIFDKVIENALQKNLAVEKRNKIFLSRSQFYKAKKAEAGLELLDNYFEKNGFEIVFPEKISLTELIYKIHNATEFASESGTTPHNILFGYDGQKTIIVERQTILNHVQANIDCVRDLDITYIDGHYTIYPVTAGYGPYILAYNKLFDKYTIDNCLVSPDSEYLTEKYMKKCLKQYMAEYKKEYYMSWGLEDWQIGYVDSIYEAYIDSCQSLGVYLKGNKIYKNTQMFEMRFIKKYVKSILRKIGIIK